MDVKKSLPFANTFLIESADTKIDAVARFAAG